ncbi:MAG: type II toxin-antitoxin system ParD family antitoxin [Deltaproteobacteria bacterium]|nr:type II toxin-antitoxin system ParD family antitoxin [Deltaproteobacteria bacterium]
MKSATTTLNISLPKPLKNFVEEQTAAEGYTSASEYVRELIRAARRRRTRSHHLESLLLEGLDSGTCIEADAAYWRAKEKGLVDRWGDLEEDA